MLQYQEALGADPALLPALRAARRLLCRADQLLMAAELLGREASLTSDPAKAAMLHCARARLLTRANGARDQVRQAYEAALELAPACLAALRSLGEHYRAEADWERLAEVYLTGARATTDPRTRAGLLCSLARVVELHFGDLGRACDLYADAADAQPDHLVALTEVERLSRYFQRHQLLVLTLTRQAELAGPGPEAAQRYDEVAQIAFLHLQDEEAAVAALREALRVDPRYVASLDRAEALLRTQEAWEELAEVLGRKAAAMETGAERAVVLCRRAEVLVERLGRSDEAMSAYKESLRLSPTYLPALRALGSHLVEQADWEGLVSLYLAEGDALRDPVARSARWMRAAEILDVQIGDPGRAAEVLKRALEGGPGRLAAVRSLAALLSRAKRWEDAADLLQQEANKATDEEQRMEFLLRMAQICEADLAQPERAAAALESVVELKPDECSVLADLARLYREMARWEDLVRVLEQQAEHLGAVGAVVSTLQEAGEVLELQLADVSRAKDRFRRTLQIRPGYVPALRALGRLLRREGAYDELYQMYVRELEIAEDAEQRCAALIRVATVLRNNLDREAEAEQIYHQVLEDEPGNAVALRALEDIYRERGDRSRFVEVLEARVAQTSAARDKAQLLCTIAEIRGEIGDPVEVVAGVLHRALDEDPTCETASRALIQLHEREGNWDLLCGLLRNDLERRSSPIRQRSQLLRLASLQQGPLADPVAALQAYRAAAALEPTDLASLQAYLAALSEDGAGSNSLERAEVLESLEAQSAAGGDLSSLLEVAEIYATEGRAIDADRLYQRVLIREPGNVMALQERSEWLRHSDDPKAFEAQLGAALESELDLEMRIDLVLRRVAALEAMGDLDTALSAVAEIVLEAPDRLETLTASRRIRLATGDVEGALLDLERLAGLRRSAPHAVTELLECGDAWRDELKNAERALLVYERALEIDSAHEATLQRVEELLAAAGSSQRLVELLERALGRLDAADEQALLHKRIATVFQREGQLDKAQHHLDQVLGAFPDDCEALRGRAIGQEAAGDGMAAADTWSTLGQVAREPEEFREAWLAVARLCGERSDQRERAESACLQVLYHAPDDPAALELLALVRETAGDFLGAAEAMGQRAEIAERGEEKCRWFMQLARLRGTLGEFGAVRDAYMEAHWADSQNPEPVHSLGAMLEHAGEIEELSALYGEYISGLTPSRKARAIPLHMELARVYRESEGQEEAAIHEYEQALSLAPEHTAAKAALADLYVASGDSLDKAVAAHKELLAAEPYRLASYRALVDIFERMRDHDRAFLTAGVLEYLGALTEDDRVGLEEYRSRAPRVARGSLDRGDRQGLLRHPFDTGAAREALLAVQSLGRRLSERSLKGLSVGRSDKLGVRSSDPIRNQIERFARLMDVEEYLLYAGGNGERLLTIVPSELPSALVVRRELFEAATPAARRYELSRALSLCASGAALLDEYEPEWILALLALSVTIAGEAVSPAAGDESPFGLATRLGLDVEAVAKRAGFKRLRKAASQPAARWLDGSRSGAAALQELQAIQRTAERAGALFAADATAVLEVFAGLPEPGEAPAGRVESLKKRSGSEELMEFLLSDEHASLRQILGLRVQ